VLEQLAEIGREADVLLEPMRRDSGPAIAAGAAFAQARDKDAIVLALAADHVVSDTPAFLAACREGLAAAEAGHIVTFGVQPERAATEYGYINPGAVIAGKVRAVAKFVEKPDPATAADYVKSGYLWNSGNFMFRAAVLSDEYGKVDSESVQAVSDAVAKAGTDLGFVKLDETAFGSAKSISIDYAVMEKTARAAVVPLAAGWSDVGSWASLHDAVPKDANGNVASGDVILESCRDTYASAHHRLVAAIGLNGIAIIETEEAVLVVKHEHAESVKRVAELVSKRERER